jgi:hypothetical protein
MALVTDSTKHSFDAFKMFALLHGAGMVANTHAF